MFVVKGRSSKTGAEHGTKEGPQHWLNATEQLVQRHNGSAQTHDTSAQFPSSPELPLPEEVSVLLQQRDPQTGSLCYPSSGTLLCWARDLIQPQYLTLEGPLSSLPIRKPPFLQGTSARSRPSLRGQPTPVSLVTPQRFASPRLPGRTLLWPALPKASMSSQGVWLQEARV